AGLIINSKEQEQGVYHITFNNAGTEQGGWTSKLKKLKFWGDDKPKGTNYQIALTGVGDKTELVLLDEGGAWVSSETAKPLLNIIQTHYNNF
ncbi:MAG: nlpB, partial [Gammaproteobacteria bacterium]|nr:nlpB [Gammaproteobacteria bacterium]